LSPTLAFRVGLDVATAVARAHERGVLHGLLSPDAVLFDRGETRPVARVRDFGFLEVYRAAGGPLPIDRRYAAPEVLRNEWDRVGWMSDVYQLGAVLYTVFTGRPPDRTGRPSDHTGRPADPSADGRPADPSTESVDRARHPVGPPASAPTDLVEELPVAADRIVAKAMATPKIARYESVEELARDLRSTLTELEGER
ncbi:MAG: protein kinase domain-containing protein, partial [Haloferacaceae archaeon]